MRSGSPSSETNDEKLITLIARALLSDSKQPRYQQIATTLAAAIESGTLLPGTALPPEPDLAERLGVSRQTVNAALSGLARRGLLVRRRRAGTFVAAPLIEQPLGELYSFLRTLQAHGLRPETRLLGYRPALHPLASPLIAGSPEALVFEIERLRLVDGTPLALETLFLPLDPGASLPLDRLATEPLYDVLDAHGIMVSHAEETLSPVRLEAREATLLDLPAGEAAFRVERTGFVEEMPVEVRISLIRGDRFRFRVHLDRSRLSRDIP